jgi:hypothetical protein
MKAGDWVRDDTGTDSYYGVVASVLSDTQVMVTWERPRLVNGRPLLITQAQVSDLEFLPNGRPKTFLEEDRLVEAAVDSLSRGLNTLASVEALVQVEGGDPSALCPTRETVAMFSLALISEVNEVANELTWKRWKKGAVPKPQLAMEETADILAFLGLFLNWLQYHGISMEQLAAEFMNKSRVNINRLSGKVEGYAAPASSQ